MIKRLPYLILTTTFVVAISGCDSIALDKVEPKASISSEVALTNRSGFEALLISVYDHMQNTSHYGQQYMLYPDALADNADVTSTNSNRYPGPVNNFVGSQLNNWNNGYAAINEANNIIAKVDALELSEANPDEIRRHLKGEALFLRALNYFDLLRAFSYDPGREVGGFNLGVILRTEPTETVADADFRARATNREGYDQVEADFQEAANTLEGIDNSKNRATKAAALGLLSRVYLYDRKWSAAEQAATNALASTGVSLVQDNGDDAYLNAWLASSHPESIFEMAMQQGKDGSSTNVNGALDALTNSEQQAFSFEVIPTQDLLDAMEDGDARSELYAPGEKAGTPVTYLRKYTGTSAPNVDRVPILRVSELYLNRAEARAQQGNNAGAMADLNTLRNARNLPSVSGMSGQALINTILHERRVEFAFEGQRLFDLKRYSRDIPKPQSIGMVPYNDFRVLGRLPTNEVDTNPMLEQNPGY